jgi:hypothetical protein
MPLANKSRRHRTPRLGRRAGHGLRLPLPLSAPVPGGMQIENIWDGYNCGFDLALLMRRVREHLVSIQRPDEGRTHETR